MDSELTCNYKKCRKKLTSVAWVTSCSHIFCNDDGSREFEKMLKCPACDTNLPEKFDIVRIDLNPSEQYKSMVLAGQSPEVIMDICSRAIAFWTYQVHQETAYQEYVGKKSKDRCAQLEHFYQHTSSKMKAETESLKQQVESLKKDLEQQKQKSTEMSEKFLEKSRHLHKLQGMYDNMRRKAISPAIFDKPQKPAQKIADHFNMPRGDDFALTTITDVIRTSSTAAEGLSAMTEHHAHNVLQIERDFVLEPVNVMEVPETLKNGPRQHPRSQYK